MAKQVRSSAASVPDGEGAGKSRKRKVSQTSSANVARELSHTQIAEHAYGLFMARGAHDGGELNDWLRAEQELRAQLG